MKKTSNIVWGAVLILVGVLFGLDAFEIADVNVFFDGWWTLIIIVPCIVGLFTEREKTGNVIGIVIGVFLLLCCQDVLRFEMLWKLIVPVSAIIIGAKLIFGGIFGTKTGEIIEKMKESGSTLENCCATFSGNNRIFDNEKFEGIELTATFGGVKCDLRNAVIESDCAIRFTSTFGGIDILVPENVNVKVSSNCIFGGVSNKTKTNKDNLYTIYVSGTCMFGGVEIK